MKLFVVITTEGVEPIALRVFSDKAIADNYFSSVANEKHLEEHPAKELKGELTGTMRMAGDDSYCVQLLERKLE